MNLCVCYSNTEQNKIEVVVDVFERKGKGRGDLYYRHAHTLVYVRYTRHFIQ